MYATRVVGGVGLQGQLWTEAVRYEDEFFGMYFPRLIALAERAWHKAPWEANITDPANQLLRQADFENFASTLGQRELLRLDRMGVAYHLPVPGGR
jgi:hexosaminidase